MTLTWRTSTLTTTQLSPATRVIQQKILTETLNETGSEQVINFITRGNNILDIFATNRQTFVTKQQSIPGVGDHDIVFAEVLRQPIKKATTKKSPSLEKS